ncbi:MAG: cytochrome c-type biogenesis protein CcmH [Gammaproteobacteria bacterium]|nr:cytochrome c-type biogenesis protein CcmH [Gammaproteobacteria bacterium]
MEVARSVSLGWRRTRHIAEGEAEARPSNAGRPALGRYGTWPTCLAMLLAAACLGASAIDGFDFLDAETAERYQRLITEFRCPKCLNESIASSGAPIAVDLRRTVRRLMEEGAADDDIRDHLQERYGDFVLYDPPFKPSTWFLWFSPLILLVTVVFVFRRVARLGAVDEPAPEDLDRARRLLRDAD